MITVSPYELAGEIGEVQENSMDIVGNLIDLGTQIFVPGNAPYLAHDDAVDNVIGRLEMPKIGSAPARN